MSKEQTAWVMVPRADAEDARDLLGLYGNNADWAALAARFDKHCAVPPEAQAVAWLLTHPLHGETLSQHPITDGDRSLGWTDIPLYAASPSPAGGVQGVAIGETNRSIIHELAADIRDRLSGEEGSAMWRNAQRIVELSRPQALTSALSSQAQTTGGVE